MREVKNIATNSLERLFSKKVGDWAQIKGTLRDDLAKYIFKETKRKPMILPVIMDI